MAEIFGLDAFAPKDVATRVSDAGVANARVQLVETFFGGMLYSVLVAGGYWIIYLWPGAALRKDP